MKRTLLSKAWNSFSVCLAVLFFSALSGAQTSIPSEETTPLPRFDDYPEREVRSGAAATVIIKSPEERLYRTNLRNSVKEPPNFAGHYSFVDWGCGTNCLGGAVVDQQTGKVFQPPLPLSKNSHAHEHWIIDGRFFFDKPPIQVRADSRLMIIHREFGGNPELFPEVFYFVWDNEEFRLIQHTIGGRTIAPTEALLVGEYKNCGKGWGVHLSPFVTAHSSFPPAPNHGFLISARTPGTIAEVTADDERVAGVYDSNDAIEYGSARAYAESLIKDAAQVTVLEKRPATLRRLPAVYIHYRSKREQSSFEEEALVTYRSGGKDTSSIFYVVWLRTAPQHHSHDRRLFLQIQNGFYLLPIPKGAPCGSLYSPRNAEGRRAGS